MFAIAAVLTAEVLEVLFQKAFRESFNTVLIGGAEEPVYLPADEEHPYHRLYYREDYISSAFHEIAHWCIAGEKRRQQVDFGYWYEPDGRSAEQQRTFESVEVKPQAVEWHLSRAAGHRFHLSADNLSGQALDETSGASDHFTEAVCRQAQQFCEQGLPARAQQLVTLLQDHFDTGDTVRPQLYQRCQL